jgi:cyclomaltodextrinase / maltogenic alpha-amylase / neopullulanase
MSKIKAGKYKHFKSNNIYNVIGVAKHSETLEKYVIYNHDGQYWIRPCEMFLEKIERNGKIMPRFTYIGE